MRAGFRARLAISIPAEAKNSAFHQHLIRDRVLLNGTSGISESRAILSPGVEAPKVNAAGNRSGGGL